MSPFQVFLWISFSSLSVYCKPGEIEPWTTNTTGEYYLFQDRPDDHTIRNLTCKEDNCIIRCNEEESCQKFNIHGGNTKNMDLQCDYPKQKELRPGSCWRANIFTQKASKVDIYCTNENCAETKFYVNKAEHANLIFDGDWAGKFATINATEVQNDLYITCNDTESCSDLSVYCPVSNKCNLNCNGTKACWNSKIYHRASSFDDLNINCDYGTDTTSCTGLTIHCDDKDNSASNTLWYDKIDKIWRCFDKESNCCPIQFKQESNEILCEPGEDCIIDCDQDKNSCHYGIIDGSKANALILKCNGDDQCKISEVKCPQHKKAECVIECRGIESCKFMNVSSALLSQLDIECGARGSCQNMRVDVTVNAYVNIGCNNEWSCGNTKFNIDGTKDALILHGKSGVTMDRKVSVTCNGRYSCEGIDLQCPYGIKDSCLLKCSDHDSSCNGVQIFAPERYEYDYLKIECPENSRSVLKPCNFMRIKCKNDKNTVLRYTKGGNKESKCNNDDCCPWISEIKNKKMNLLGQDKGEYGTVVAIFCVLGSMYLLTTGCSMFS